MMAIKLYHMCQCHPDSMLRLSQPPALPRRRHLLPHPAKQLKHGQAKRIGNHFEGIDRGIRLSPLYPAQIRLVEAALLTKLDLAQTDVQAQVTDTGSKLLGEGRVGWRWLHTHNCLTYALIHINTNSYIWGCLV